MDDESIESDKKVENLNCIIANQAFVGRAEHRTWSTPKI